MRKPVVQIRKELGVEASFSSAKEATKVTGIHNITAVCRGERKTAGGFLWKYST